MKGVKATDEFIMNWR